MDSRKSAAAAGDGAQGAHAGASPVGEGARPSDRRRYDRILNHLEREIELLRIETEKFLAGVEKRLPEAARQAIERQLRLLRDEPLQSATDRFRAAGLEARFNAYQELFNRRLRAMEEGRGPARHTPVPAAPRFDAEQGIVVAERPDGREAASLLAAAIAQGAAGSHLDPERFAAYLAQQAAAIRERTGCSAVQFRLAIEEGRAKLKARPLNVPPAGG